jgi:hypothetical protein
VRFPTSTDSLITFMDHLFKLVSRNMSAQGCGSIRAHRRSLWMSVRLCLRERITPRLSLKRNYVTKGSSSVS